MINSEFLLATRKNVVYSVTRLRKNTYILKYMRIVRMNM